MLRNQATALLRHEHLTTTVPRAKELNARRLVMQDVQDREVVKKLFDTLAPRFQARPGGYTRLLRVGYRKGDSAEVAQVELVGSEFDPRAAEQGDAVKGDGTPKPKGVGERLRAAAERLRGKKSDPESSGKASAKPSRGVSRKSTTPRKAGGS
jgi:large subunit ribosomal protein L17